MFALRAAALAVALAILLSASAVARFSGDPARLDAGACAIGSCPALWPLPREPSEVEAWMSFMAARSREISVRSGCSERERPGGPILTGVYTMPMRSCFAAPAVWP